MRGELGEGAQPRREQLAAGRGQVRVPDVQGGRRLGRRRSAPGPPAQRLEQRAALLEDPVVVGPDPGEPRPAGHHQLVQEPPPLRRVALDDGQILGREHHGPQHPDQLPRPAQRRPVQLGPVGLARGDLDLQLQLPRIVQPGLHPRPDDRPLGPEPHQRDLRGHPVRRQRRQVLDRLDQIRLPLPVGPDERRHPGPERHIHLRVRPEIGQLQMIDEHPHHPRSSQPRRRSSRRRPQASRQVGGAGRRQGVVGVPSGACGARWAGRRPPHPAGHAHRSVSLDSTSSALAPPASSESPAGSSG